MPKVLIYRIKGDETYNRDSRDRLLERGMIIESRPSNGERSMYVATQKGQRALVLNFPELYIDAMGPGQRFTKINSSANTRSDMANTALMCNKAGAGIKGMEKPSLYNFCDGKIQYEKDKAYYYDSFELKELLKKKQDYRECKISACNGVVIRNNELYMMYTMKKKAVYFTQNAEIMFIKYIMDLFSSFGVEIKRVSQVIILNRPTMIKKVIADKSRMDGNGCIKSALVSNCYIVLNNETGEQQLHEIIFGKKAKLSDNPNLREKQYPEADCDFETVHGEPVFDMYHIEIKKLLTLYNPVKYHESRIPVVLCHDFFEDALYELFGPKLRYESKPYIAYED